MGLSVSIGVLAGEDQDPEFVEHIQRQFEVVNRVLAENNLPPHHEPETLPDFHNRDQLMGFPYSWIHYLRRAVAFARQAPEEFTPNPADESPSEHIRIDNELSIYMDSHFICHSDCDGYYVPIDFPEPLFDFDKNELPGGMLGSSQRALQEIILAAPLIDITLQNGVLTDEDAKMIAEEEDEAHPCWIERKVWLTFFEAFRHSVQYKCAVVFG